MEENIGGQASLIQFHSEGFVGGEKKAIYSATDKLAPLHEAEA